VSQQTPPSLDEPDSDLLVPIADIPAPPAQTKRAPLLARFAVTMALMGCLVGMGWALSMHEETKGPDDIAIEKLTPPPGAETVPGQTPIIIDMAFGYDIVLSIDGRIIPKSEIVEVESLGQFTFSQKSYEERLVNGVHVAQLVYWPKAGDQQRDGQLYQWSFSVV
jgi:hypothetical protein